MISSAAHSRWTPWLPSWIWFPSITGQTPGSIDLIFMWLIGDDYRKVPFNDQLGYSSKMAGISFLSIRGQATGSIDPIFLWLIEMAAIWFPSIGGQTPGSIDPIFSAAYWG
jgi:hypothetical protein